MKKLSTAVAVAALIALTLTGCATSAIKSASAPAAGASNAQAADASEKPDTARFGTTYTWDDGMQVTVSKPEKFKPSEYAAGTEGKSHFVLFTITVKNGSKQKIDLLGSATAQSGDAEASSVFDTAKGVEGSPNTPILPGRKVTYRAAFGVANPADIVLQYGPDFTHENAIFTSK